MKELKLELSRFKLKDFIDVSMKRGKDFLNVPAFLVTNISEFDFDDCYDKYEKASLDFIYNDLLSGKYLFVTFSDCGANYPNVGCIDGEEYQTISEDEVDDFLEDDEREDFIFTNNLNLGETSNLGFLLQLKDGQLSIQSAQFYMDATGGLGPSSVAHLVRYSAIEIREDMEVFENPMKNHLNKFTI